MAEDYPNLLIGIGASAGGLDPLREILSKLPRDLQACIIIASHRDPSYRSELAAVLDRVTDLRVREPIDGDTLTCTVVYVGQPKEMIEIEGGQLEIAIDDELLRRSHRIDDLFSSIAEAAGRNAVGIILSGMLRDGVEGLKAISARGGLCIVQTPSDAEYESMPRSALEEVGCDFIGDTKEIAAFVTRLASDRNCS